MLIRPYSDSSLFDYNNPCEPTAANFPCCKFLLRCDETSGNSLTDKISGRAFAVSGGSMSFVTNGIQVASGVGLTAAVLQNSIAVGANSALLLAIGNIAPVASGVHVDSATTTLLSVNTSGGSAASDGTNTAAAGNATASSIVATAIKYVSGATAQGQKLECTASTYTATAAVNSTPGNLVSIPTIDRFGITTIAASSTYYMVALFVFANGIPVDTKSAIAWMLGATQRGIKGVYPGWKGVT